MTKAVTPKIAAVKDKVPRKSARKSVAGAQVAGAVKAAGRNPTPSRKRAKPAAGTASPSIGPEERHHLIEVAAYYVAERRGFHGASSHDDWLQAEREIDAMIAIGKFAV
jgi:hypothetical protein